MVCSKCKSAKYCSRDCQVEAFSSHKKECKRLQQEQLQVIRLTGGDYPSTHTNNDGVSTLQSSKTGKSYQAGKYQRPKNVQIDERFFVKIQVNLNDGGPLLVYDKTRSCCFYVMPHHVGIYEPIRAKVLAQTATGGLKSYFEASFDSDDICTIYPTTSTLKKW